MNTRKLLVKLVALACCGTVSGVAMATTQEEIDKQVSNMIGSAISSRIVTTAPKAAPTDFGGYGGIVQVQVSFAATKTNATAYYGGADYNLSKDFIGGAALYYGSQSNGSSQGLSPYLSYLLNQNFYLLGKLNFGDTRSNTGPGSTSAGGDISINGFVKSGDWLAKAGLGVGQNSSRVQGGATTSSTSRAANGELGYTFAPTWQVIGGVNYNNTTQANSGTTTASIGLETEIAKDAAVGLKYTTNVADNLGGTTNLRLNVVTLSARFRF